MDKLNVVIKIFVLIGCMFTAHAQNQICFDYDAAGNRIKRYNCGSSPNQEDEKSDVLALEKSEPLLESGAIQKDKQLEYMELIVYPNPTLGKFTLVVNTAIISSARIKVYDYYGRLVHQQKYKDGELDISHVNPGIYSVVLYHNDKLYSTNIIRMAKE